MFKKLNLLNVFLILILVFSGCSSKDNKKDNDNKVPVPSAPDFVTVTPANKQLTVTWLPVSNATEYEVWYSTSNDTKEAQKLTKNVIGTSCVITDLQNNTLYYIWIKSKNLSGTSDFSKVATGKPTSSQSVPYAPMYVNIQPGNQELHVSWPAVAGALSYEIWYSTSDNSSTATKFGDNVMSTECTITGLTNDITYYVWVRGVNEEGAGNFSAGVSGTPCYAEAIIKGLVNSTGGFTVTLVETSKTLYYGNSAYFSFDKLKAGNYHVRIERAGYQSIIKQVTITSDEEKDLGELTIDTLLPDGTGTKTIQPAIVYGHGYCMDFVEARFTVNRVRKAYIEYSLHSLGTYGDIYSHSLLGYGDYLNNYIWFLKGTTSGTVPITLNPGINYVLEIFNNPTSSYSKVYYEIDVGSPKINLSKTWSNSNTTEQIAIDCMDYGTGLDTVRYAITNSMAKPSSFTTIPANTAVQIINNGVWFLHVEATDKEDPVNTSYRVEGPYIIQK